MAFNTEVLKTEVQSCINALDNTCSGQSILLSAISSTIDSAVSVSVPSADDLPDLVNNSISNGTTVYVADLDSYFTVNDTSWTELYGRVLRDDSRRELYAWGCNNIGQIGDGTTTNRCVPTQESTAATDWCAVATSGCHTTAVKTTGELYAWGCNNAGQLGDGTTGPKCVPTQECTAATDWCAVAAASRHTAAVKTTGELYSWGNNFYGTLGDGTRVGKCAPTQECTAATDWCAVAAVGFHTAAIKTTGALYAWGYNALGQIGDGTTVDKCVPTQESTAATDWCAVAANDAHTAAVKTTGALYAWGSNGCGTLGDGTTTNRCVPTQESTAATDWCAVAAGCVHTAAVKTTGELYAWGGNALGQIGDGTTVSKCAPTQECTAATDWCAVATGDTQTAAVKTTGALYAWGSNSFGQTGDGTTSTNRCAPTQECTAATDWCAVAAGDRHTAAIKRVT